MKFARILLILTLFFGFNAQAEDMGFTVGFQNTSADGDGISYDAGIGYYVGWIGYFDVANVGAIRSGAMLSQRKISYESGSGNEDVEWLSIDIPVNYVFKFSDAAAAYGGLKFGLNVSDDCTEDGCNPESETFHYGLNFGGAFTMTPNWAVEVDVVMGLSDLADNVEWSNSVGAGLVYLF